MASAKLDEIRRRRAKRLGHALARRSGVPFSEIFGSSHDPEVVAVRHLLWQMLRDLELSYMAIAKAVGRDHTSVLAACRKQLLPTEERLRIIREVEGPRLRRARVTRKVRVAS